MQVSTGQSFALKWHFFLSKLNLFCTIASETMQATVLTQASGRAKEQFTISVPVGTRQRLEEYRKQNGLKSRNQAVYELLSRGFIEYNS